MASTWASASASAPESTSAPASRRGVVYRLEDGHDLENAMDVLRDLQALGVRRVVLPSTEGALTQPDALALWLRAARSSSIETVFRLRPSRVCVHDLECAWWRDVLEWGPVSASASFFDIEWATPGFRTAGRIALPLLERPYGMTLEAGEFSISYRPKVGRFVITYRGRTLPVSPSVYGRILELPLTRLRTSESADDPAVEALQSLVYWFFALPSVHPLVADPDLWRRPSSWPLPSAFDARSEMDVGRPPTRHVKEKCEELAILVDADRRVAEELTRTLDAINGIPGNAESLIAIHRILELQPYRLVEKQGAEGHINYWRRLGDTDETVCRVEDVDVFRATHAPLLALLSQEEGVVGLEIEDLGEIGRPRAYLAHLASITQVDVTARAVTFDLSDFSRDVRFVLQDSLGALRLDRIERRMRRLEDDLEGLRRRILRKAIDRVFVSEVERMSVDVERLAARSWHSSDFTSSNIRRALRWMGAELSPRNLTAPLWFSDVCPFQESFSHPSTVKARAPSSIQPVISFIEQMLDAGWGEGAKDGQRFDISDVEAFRDHFRKFVYAAAMHARQSEIWLSTPWSRPGTEGTVTAWSRSGVDTRAEFHRRCQERLALDEARLMDTTARNALYGEDVEARFDAMSELSDDWARQLRVLSRRVSAPFRGDAEIFLRLLVGTWTSHGSGQDSAQGPGSDYDYADSIIAFALAAQAAKESTDRMAPTRVDEDETPRPTGASGRAACRALLRDLFRDVTASVGPTEASGCAVLTGSLGVFQKRVAWLGALNSLSRLVLKHTVPGVAVTCEGNEAWDLRLKGDGVTASRMSNDGRLPVRPTSRRLATTPEHRRQLLSEVRRLEDEGPLDVQRAKRLFAAWESGLPKVYFLKRLIDVRHRFDALFQEGEYHPVPIEGAASQHLVCFVRRLEGQTALVCVSRLFASMGAEPGALFPASIWTRTRLALDGIAMPTSAPWVDGLTGQRVAFRLNRHGQLPVSRVLRQLPWAVLVCTRRVGSTDEPAA
ncbi:MAG: hypothetical protein IPK13_08925 [Deltaproteobacteria bacterium]|nr:hypothetical protein [Deltaproteobacteria bacterium]